MDDTPRFEVRYVRDENGDDQFDWGVCGRIGFLELFSAIARTQLILLHEGNVPRCERSALVLEWTGSGYELSMHPDIPIEPLVGMLEIIKVGYANNSKAAVKLRNQQVILGSTEEMKCLLRGTKV
jgi:hypothetical protein